MKHAVIWVDHKEARIVKLDDEGPRYEAELLRASSGQHDKSHKHTHSDPRFLEDVARQLSTFDEVLVTGPGTAKDDLATFVEQKHPAWRSKIVKVESSDHPTDGQLADRARRILRAADRMQGVHVR